MKENWLLAEIETGICKLLCLGLEGQPAAELIEGTVQGWFESITRGRALEPADAPRIREAFSNVMARCRRWPSPVEFLEAMPRRESASVTALPVGEEERKRRDAAARATLARLGAMLNDEGRITSTDTSA